MTSVIHQPQDKLFKLSMAERAVAKEFFETHIPAAILEKIDLESLKLEKETFVDKDYKTTEADVVYSAKMGDTTAYLYLLCEQQTEVDTFLAFRLLGYTLRIMSKHRKQHPKDPLPLVYPMVVYIGEEPWDAPLDIFPLFGEAETLAREILFKPYQLLDLQRIDDAALRQQILFGFVAFALKHRNTTNFQAFVKHIIPWIIEVESYDASGTALSRVVIKYVIDRSPKGNKDVLVEAAQHLPETLRGDIMTIAQQWKEEGRQEAMQEVMTIAKQWQELFQFQLQKRFGTLPSTYIQRIESADAQTLLHWGGALLDAKTLEAVFEN
jgi:predicted transposase/invertase (TIGR01784 family)